MVWAPPVGGRDDVIVALIKQAEGCTGGILRPKGIGHSFVRIVAVRLGWRSCKVGVDIDPEEGRSRVLERRWPGLES